MLARMRACSGALESSSLCTCQNDASAATSERQDKQRQDLGSYTYVGQTYLFESEHNYMVCRHAHMLGSVLICSKTLGFTNTVFRPDEGENVVQLAQSIPDFSPL